MQVQYIGQYQGPKNLHVKSHPCIFPTLVTIIPLPPSLERARKSETIKFSKDSGVICRKISYIVFPVYTRSSRRKLKPWRIFDISVSVNDTEPGGVAGKSSSI